MTLIKCAACERDISPNAAACPHCGEPLPKPTPVAGQKTAADPLPKWAAFILVGFVLCTIFACTWNRSEKAMIAQAHEAADRARAREVRIAEAIATKTALTEMTFDEVRAAWGEPARKTRSVTAGHEFETWWYASGSVATFLDGRVERLTVAKR